MIAIPESVAFYWGEPANRAAVKVLAGSSEVPPDLSLDEVERFEVASLASERVRLDFWRMLRSLWSATFGAAVRTALPTARLLSFGEHATFSPAADVTPSIQNAWSDGLTFGVYEVPNHGHLVTSVWLDPATADRKIVLEFYFLDVAGRVDLSDGLEIAPDWGSREGWRTLQPHDLTFSIDGVTIDPAPLDVLARSAMMLLANTLTSNRPSSTALITRRTSKHRSS